MVLIAQLVQSNISLKDEVPEALFLKMLVFWDVTSYSLATGTGMLQVCNAFVFKFKLCKGRCIVSASS
jgi:hypothetical protein